MKLQMPSLRSRLWFAVALLAAVPATPAVAEPPFRIQVLDEESGWPVPLVTLRTVHEVEFHTDNAGVAAFDLPELEGVETWLHLEADGYGLDPDGFGYRGFRVVPERGGRHEVRVRRQVPAKRLGRFTGAGLFAESQKLGEELDWPESGILGCDSVQTVRHRGRLFWAWGDTLLARYPLGIFHMLGAASEGRPFDSLEPPLRPGFDFYRDEAGVPRAVAEIEGRGPTWINGLASLPDASGRERLVGFYVKVEPPLSVYRCGLCVWDEEAERFVDHRVLWDVERGGEAPLEILPGHPAPESVPRGHPVRWTDAEGEEWVLFGDPFPILKVPASFEAWSDPASWIPLEAPGHLRAAGGDGPGEAQGRRVAVHRGAMMWHPWRRRWVAIVGENGGEPSHLGEIWYTEADAPTGPWGPAVKVLSHRKHTFYNPKVHPGFVDDDSPVLLFEGTYTKTFSRNAAATPRHDYNQVLYRLDLDDPALAAARGE